MEIDNKTIAITGIIAMGLLGLLIGYKELSMAISCGLFGLINVKPVLPNIAQNIGGSDETEPP